jgi:hypothetical protein
MKLDVFERILLQNILPREGDYITLKLVRKLREALSFSEKENDTLHFKYHWRCPKCSKVELLPEVGKCPDCDIYMVSDGKVTWDEKDEVVKDVHMGDKMLALCTTTLKKLSDDGRMEEQHMSLYEKFVKGDEEDDG